MTKAVSHTRHTPREGLEVYDFGRTLAQLTYPHTIDVERFAEVGRALSFGIGRAAMRGQEGAGRFAVNLFVQGTSGTGLAALVAPRLISCGFSVDVCLISKPGDGEDRHHRREAAAHFEQTGRTPERRHFSVFLDDFISSGETLQRVDSLVTRKSRSRSFLWENIPPIECIAVTGDPSFDWWPERLLMGGCSSVICGRPDSGEDGVSYESLLNFAVSGERESEHVDYEKPESVPI